MSVRAIAAVLDLDRDVKGARRLVMIALADNMNDEGFAYPKRETIARKAGLSDDMDYISKLLRSLERDGYIVRHINAWAGTLNNIPEGKRPNVYRFTDKVWSSTDRPQGRENTPTQGREKTPTPGEADFPYQNRHLEPSPEPPPYPHGQTTLAAGEAWGRLERMALAAGCTARQWQALVADVTNDPTVRIPIAVAETRIANRQWPPVTAELYRPHDCADCNGGWVDSPNGVTRCPNIYESETA